MSNKKQVPQMAGEHTISPDDGANGSAPDLPVPGFGIYVHWPFCASKCPYCDFNSHVRMGGIDEQRFLAAYTREIAHMAQLAKGEPDCAELSSIFFGGGTPSLMEPATVGAILDAIAAHWSVAPDVEITLEANPSSVEADRFKGYRVAGINRVSLGVQSLYDEDLKALGRLHTAQEAGAAIAVAANIFARYSFDLIYARPHQTLEGWRRELQLALPLSGGHLSLYQLTIEDGTPFAALHRAGRLIVPDSGPAHDLYELTQEIMEAHGLPAYEISNHAAAGERSRHNLTYWRYGCYAGIGAGAHGRLMINGARMALSNECSPDVWLSRIEESGSACIEDTALTAGQQADEMLLMGLRLSEGVDLARLRRLTGLAPDEAELDRLVAQDLIERLDKEGESGRTGDRDAGRASGRIRATRTGRFVLNQIVLRVSQALRPVTV